MNDAPVLDFEQCSARSGMRTFVAVSFSSVLTTLIVISMVAPHSSNIGFSAFRYLR